MEKLKVLLESDWKKLNEQLKQGFNNVKSLIPELETSLFYRSITGSFYFRGFAERINVLEEIRLEMLKLLKEKSEIDRSEFHRLIELEPGSKSVRKLYELLSLNPFHNYTLYKKLRIKFHKERELFQEILDEFERDKKIDTELIKLFGSVHDALSSSFEDFYLALYNNTHRREPYILLSAIREFQEFLKSIYQELSGIVSKDREIRNNLEAIGSVIHFLAGDIENEDEFFKDLDKERGKGNRKVEGLLRNIIKRTIITEKEIDRELMK